MHSFYSLASFSLMMPKREKNRDVMFLDVCSDVMIYGCLLRTYVCFMVYVYECLLHVCVWMVYVFMNV